MDEPGRHVVFFRAARGPEDTYKRVFEEANFSVHFVRALQFEFVNSEHLLYALREKYAGLIFTSQTAVESTIQAIRPIKGKGPLDSWADVPVFVVGKATAAAVNHLGLTPVGSACGNAEILANTITKYKDKSSILPLLFPCGNLARDTIPCELEKVGLKVNCLVCYNTIRDPKLEEHLHQLSQLRVLSGQCCIVFFSPSGVEFVLPVLALHCNMQIIKVIAIGPTTAESIKQAGISPTVAHEPNAYALLDALHQIHS